MKLNKKLVFISGLFPSEIRSEIFENSKGVIQNAADVLQWAFVHGLDSHNIDFTIVNLPYIGSYPFRYKKPYMHQFSFSHHCLSSDINVGFLNISLIKLLSRYINLRKYLKHLFRKIDKETVIVIYAIHTPFLKAAIYAKKKYGAKICLIVPDLPEFMGAKSNPLYDLLKKIQDKLLLNYMMKVDAFVLLTTFMSEYLKVENRPWVCVEGIYDSKEQVNISTEKNTKKIIFYSGTLSVRYGIINLLNAFQEITDENYNLWICGEGDARMQILNRAEKDNRIKFWGQIDRTRVLIMQKEATVLVNPRTSGDFTKYSFPSKIIEYLASGTPVIMHKLDGIPDEYYEYCFIASEENSQGLRNAILNVCEMNAKDLNYFGTKAQNFILNKKNPRIQVGKILEMINSL